MSPEQLAESTVGPASDLYALGVLMFELLTGRLPHEASTLGALLVQVSNRAAPRVSTLRPDLPPALNTLVADLLEKRPERRPADANAVADQQAIFAKHRHDQRGTHAGVLRIGVRRIEDGPVGVVDADVHGATHFGIAGMGLRFTQPATEFGADERGGHVAGHFARVVAAHAVGQHDQC